MLLDNHIVKILPNVYSRNLSSPRHLSNPLIIIRTLTFQLFYIINCELRAEFFLKPANPKISSTQKWLPRRKWFVVFSKIKVTAFSSNTIKCLYQSSNKMHNIIFCKNLKLKMSGQAHYCHRTKQISNSEQIAVSFIGPVSNTHR